MKIDYGEGDKVHYQGLKFTGSPVDVFWTIMTPVLKREIGDTMAAVYETAKGYPPRPALKAIDEGATLLTGFVSQVYVRMSEVDRLLRGEGFPDKIVPRDPTSYISRILPEIERRRIAYRALLPESRFAQMSWWVERNKWLAGLMATAIVGAAGAGLNLVIKAL
ncbi:MAG: hypothetical protein IPK81_14130 [Rhodospirillales bacterium]|nr:MAG: hypothetical protein IPK81_14130 [Rhodospirillales bacterium]